MRTPQGHLRHLRFAVVGCGARSYGRWFNSVAKEVDDALGALGAHRLCPRLDGDSDEGDVASAAERWAVELWDLVRGDGPPADALGSTDTDSEVDDTQEQPLMDLEDLVAPNKSTGGNDAPKEMVSPSLNKALTKQGYKIVGTHSGVKLCRWTKSMLRGRGGCYKHTFYGIASHRCMELTPSLVCAFGGFPAPCLPLLGGDGFSFLGPASHPRRRRAPIAASSAGGVPRTRGARRSSGRSTSRQPSSRARSLPTGD